MEDATITVVQQLPSTKDQVKAAAIGLAISLAATVIIVGGITVVSNVATVVHNRKVRKAEKLANKK